MRVFLPRGKSLPIFLSVAVLAGCVLYFFMKTRQAKNVLNTQTVSTAPIQTVPTQAVLEVSNEEADALYNLVSKIMVLPDEKPKVSTVKGASKLKQDPFFRNARDGDKILVFEQNRRAILYNPSEHRVIEVGKVEINKSSPPPQAGEETAPAVSQ